jgi:hypothetical protein
VALGNLTKALRCVRELLDARIRELREKQAFETDADLARRLQNELELEDVRRQVRAASSSPHLCVCWPDGPVGHLYSLASTLCLLTVAHGMRANANLTFQRAGRESGRGRPLAAGVP